MDDETLLTLGVLAIGGFFLYKHLTKSPTTTGATATTFQNLGYETSTGTSLLTGKEYAYIKSGDTTYRFAAGDYDKLNFAQKFLLNIGAPTRWILG